MYIIRVPEENKNLVIFCGKQFYDAFHKAVCDKLREILDNDRRKI